MTNIILIGLRGAGKTTIGKKLAKTMKRKFIDTDREIEKQTRSTISKLVATKGWFYFRKLETYVVRRVSKYDNCIISTGGGAVMSKENAKQLSQKGFFVYLNTPITQIATRLSSDKSRPALTNAKSLEEELEATLSKREARYLELADLTFTPSSDTDDFKKDLKLNVRALNIQLGAANPEFQKPE